MSDATTSSEVAWLSSAEGVATVNGGLVTFVAAGDVIITATSTADDTQAASVSFLVVTHNTLNLDFVAVTGGSFQMGSPVDEIDRNEGIEVLHTVTVSDFYMSKYEITFEQYDAYVSAIGDEDTVPSPSDNGWGRETRPVIHVSWEDAVGFLNWLSTEDGLTLVYTINEEGVTANFNANGYRLPTEAEWEYAARGGENAGEYNIYSCSNTVGYVGWYTDNSDADGTGKKTQPVGGKAPNELGLYDMSGNVWEWCWDKFGPYSSEPQSDPTGPSSISTQHVMRGGSWSNEGHYLRSAHRNLFSLPTNYLGIRLVRRP